MDAVPAALAGQRSGPLRFQLFLFAFLAAISLPGFAGALIGGDTSVLPLLVVVVLLAMLAGNAAWRLSLSQSAITPVTGTALVAGSLPLVLMFAGSESSVPNTATLAVAGVQLGVGLLLIPLQAQLPRPVAGLLYRWFPKRFLPPPGIGSPPLGRLKRLALGPNARAAAGGILDVVCAGELLLNSFLLVGVVIFLLPSVLVTEVAQSARVSVGLATAAFAGVEIVLLRAFRRSRPLAGLLAPPVLLLATAGSALLVLSPYPLSVPGPSIFASGLTLLASRWYLRVRRMSSTGASVHDSESRSAIASGRRQWPGDGPPSPPKPWSPSELWLAFAIIPVLLFGLGFAFVGLATFLAWGLGSDPSLDVIELAALEGELLGLWIVVLYLVRRKGHPWSVLGLRPFPLRTLAVLPLSFPMETAALTSFNTALLPALPAVQAYEASLDPYFEPSAVAIAILLLGSVVVAPIVEELLFRGFFFTGFRSYIGPVGAAVVSALLFSLAHTFPVLFPFSLNLSPSQALSAFLGGLVMAGMRHDSDSIFPSMIAHALWNLAVVV